MLIWAHNIGECAAIRRSMFSIALVSVVFSNLSSEVEVVPVEDTVFDQAVAGFCDLLFLFSGLGVFLWVSDGHGASEAVG